MTESTVPYVLALAVLIEAINSFLILPQLFFNDLYRSSVIILVFENSSCYYFNAICIFAIKSALLLA